MACAVPERLPRYRNVGPYRPRCSCPLLLATAT
uniref:Uncharacterized protein n=1 Tax=Anopheles albimanus TaxID=7167 RepID=A0A182FZG6_ANOAL